MHLLFKILPWIHITLEIKSKCLSKVCGSQYDPKLLYLFILPCHLFPLSQYLLCWSPCWTLTLSCMFCLRILEFAVLSPWDVLPSEVFLTGSLISFRLLFTCHLPRGFLNLAIEKSLPQTISINCVTVFFIALSRFYIIFASAYLVFCMCSCCLL